MDNPTITYYSTEAKSISDKYNSVPSGIHQFFKAAFIEGTRILDIGCGSGRDMAELVKKGFTPMALTLLPKWFNTPRNNIRN